MGVGDPNTEQWRKDAEDGVRRMLLAIGDNPARGGLEDTPARVVRSWKEIYGGYSADIPSIFTVFQDNCDEMVVLRDIEFYSTCEHHLQPFFGKAHIGYIPNGSVVGISKLARVLDAFAKRLQIQERIGQQVSDAIMKHLNPLGCGVIMEAKHLCMCSRGVGKQNSVMTTSSMQGVFRANHKVQDEFLRMCGK